MATIKDETVDSLRDIINKLEARVQQLEAKLVGGRDGGASKSVSESIRMILIGPPGAGARFRVASSTFDLM